MTQPPKPTRKQRLVCVVQKPDALPNNTNLAFVIVQHQDPSHAGVMPELLQHSTTMPVLPVKDRVKVKPNCVYVIPSNKDMSLLRVAR